MVGCSPAHGSSPGPIEPGGVEAAFRAALSASLASLPLCDRNLLQFHYAHRLAADQLAELFGSHRAAITQKLARIHERLLRETLHQLTARLPLDRRALTELTDRVRRRFDAAIARLLQ